MPRAVLTNRFNCDSFQAFGRPGRNASWPVSRVLSTRVAPCWMTIHLERLLPGASCNQPGRRAGIAWRLPAVPPLFGFAPSGVCLAKPCCQSRGALLPHLFTLAARTWRFVSVALSLGLPPPDVIRHFYPVEPGLSSPARLSTLAEAAIRPTGGLRIRRDRA